MRVKGKNHIGVGSDVAHLLTSTYRKNESVVLLGDNGFALIS